LFLEEVLFINFKLLKMKKQLQKTYTIFLAFIFLISVHLKAQIPPALATQLQQILNNRVLVNGDKGVSASLIMANGDTWSGTAGVGQNSVSITDTTVFHGASITKANVATLILLLAESNLLHLDSSWTKYISLNANFNPTITIRQLLNHTSGIKDHLETPSAGTLIPSNFNYSFTPQEILENIVDDTPLFAPGTNFSYATSNYALLSLIAQTVTGNPVQQELHSRIWDPLGMTHTYFGGFESYSEPRAGVWWNFGSGMQNYSNQSYASMLTLGYGGANIVTTPGDLAKFARALYTGTLLTSASFNQMKTFAPNSTSFWNGYGLGVHRMYSGAISTLGHDGYYTNMSDMFHSYDYGFTLVTMTNTETQIFAIYKAMYTAIKNYITLNVKENGLMESLHVFPNPTANNFTVKFDFETKDVQLTVIDYTGKIVHSTSSTHSQSLDVNTSELPVGIYTIKIRSADYVWTKKLVIAK
jgi:D-alanyl-D-alanine carboxypeptidase